MRLPAKVVSLALCSLLLLSGAVQAEGWLTSWEQASKESKSSGKPILMDFTGSDWCGWCKKLKAEVFDTAEFKAWAKKNVVLLELDFPQGIPQDEKLKKQNAELQKKYQIEGYPTILFVDAAGTVKGKYGYDRGGPTVWTAKAESKIKGH